MNDLSSLIHPLLAQGLKALRGNCVMPRLVNADYSALAAEKGSSIEVPVPSVIVAQEVQPGAAAPNTPDLALEKVTIKLDQWWEAPFYLTDNDLLTVEQGVLPLQAEEAVKALATRVNGHLLGLGRKFNTVMGEPGVTPFTAVEHATTARKLLNKNLAPLTDRRVVLDPDAEAAALALPGFSDVSRTGDNQAIIEGTLGRRYGFDWAMDQQVPLFESADLPAGATLSLGSAHEAGSRILRIKLSTGTATLRDGDVLKVNGHSHVVTAEAALSTAETTVAVYPALAAKGASGAAVELFGSHVLNLAFHRDAIAFATRPLVDSSNGLGNLIQSAVDPVSGLSMRLEVSREHKRTRFAFDILYGAEVVRRELGVRIAG